MNNPGYQDFVRERVLIEGKPVEKPWTPSFVFHGSGVLHKSGTGCIACPCDCAGGIIADNRFPLYDPKPLASSAVLAGFYREPGVAVVAERGAAGFLCSVSYSEILAKLSDRNVPLQDADLYLASLDLTNIPFDGEHARVAASLRPLTRSLGLSFADRACLAAASVRRLPVLTADRGWAEAKIGVDILLIR